MQLLIKDAAVCTNPVPAGLAINGDSNLQLLTAAIENSEVIAIDFPQFVDGRGYSQARLLREQYRFQGELRATGNVLYDQLYFMSRCGFNSFLLNEEEVARVGGLVVLLEAFAEISLGYQPALDSTPVLSQLRRSI